MPCPCPNNLALLLATVSQGAQVQVGQKGGRLNISDCTFSGSLNETKLSLRTGASFASNASVGVLWAGCQCRHGGVFANYMKSWRWGGGEPWGECLWGGKVACIECGAQKSVCPKTG